MTHYRLEPSGIRGVRSFLIALVVSCGIVGFVYGGCLWVRDNVFPPPDPIELRHRIEKAEAWPSMIELAEKVLDGQKVTYSGGLYQKLYDAVRMNDISVFKDERGISGVYLSFGGADNEYGILVCRRGATSPVGVTFRYIQRWGDGIWYVADIPPRTPRVVGVPLPRE